MMKRSLLAVAVTALSAQAAYAAPFMPMDARGLAMGNTGVASAKRAHAPAYNPSLLAQAQENDDFAILFPQLGVSVADEEEMIDEAQRISDDIFPAFENIVGDAGAGLEYNIDQLNNSIASFQTVIDNLPGSGTGSSTLADIQNANTDLVSKLQAVDNDLNSLNTSTTDLTNSLRGISGNPLSAKLGVGGALAIPGKKFAAAISVQGSANISALANFTNSDLNLLGAYVPAAQEYVDVANSLTDTVQNALDNSLTEAELANELANANADQLLNLANGFTSTTTIDGNPVIDNGSLSAAASDPNLSSNLQIVAVAMVDVGLSFAREFEFGGEKVAIGITPKLQKISTFHYADEVDGFDDVDEDTFKDTQKDYTHFNLDIGASYRLGESGKWMVGVVGKNLLGGSFDYEDVWVTPKNSDGTATGAPAYKIEGGSVELNPQFRAGVAYNGDWTSLALDVDLVENDPVAFEAATQYASLGVELDVFSALQLRAGYRTNLSASDSNIASIGLGLSPFGLHIDIAAMANLSKPEKEAGVALETGFYF